MKTKLFVLTILLMGIVCMNAYAQEKSNKANQGWVTGTYWSPIYCDGQMVDFLEGGTLLIHYVTRSEYMAFYWEIDQLKGEVQSSVTEEVFKIRETDKVAGVPGFFEVTWRYNLIGNMGTHYHGVITMNLLTGELTIGKTVCN
uniref:hypothetical protein n=1 Tax=uncultured Draconibacterium sp. TaxID=1573823 RepID=UPI003217748C